MISLQIQVEEEFHRQLKVAAATHGRTLREECIVRLSIAPPADMLAKPVINGYDQVTDKMRADSLPVARDWKVKDLKPIERGHNPKTCKVYGCLLCKDLKAK